jgi:hypothetical protein
MQTIHVCGQTDRQVERKKAVHDSGYLSHEHNHRHADIQLTVCSGSIPGNTISRRFCTSWVFEGSTFMSVIWFPLWEDAGHVSLLEPGLTTFRISIQFCKSIVHLSITLHEIRYTSIQNILQCIKLIIVHSAESFLLEKPWVTQLVKKYLDF